MSDKSTTKFIRSYFDDAPPTAFFSRMFQSPRVNFHLGEKIEFDIERNGEDVAIAVQGVDVDYRSNSTDIFTNKEFLPPVFKEKFGLTSADLFNRGAGEIPFTEVTFRAKLTKRMLKGMRKIEEKIRRANELQASQVLQTGTATMVDKAGDTIYEIDYKPKATHFPTTGGSWDTGTPDIQGDLLSLANVIRADGKNTANMLVMGETAYQSMINDSTMQALMNLRRVNVIDIDKGRRQGADGTFHGTIDVGSYTFDIWTYDGRFDDIQTGNSTKFLADDKVIMKSTNSRLDATFGAIPHIGKELGRTGANILPGLPRRFGSSANGMDMNVNVWLTADGEQIFGGVGSRSLYIPTAIDTYGCLDTQT